MVVCVAGRLQSHDNSSGSRRIIKAYQSSFIISQAWSCQHWRITFRSTAKHLISWQLNRSNLLCLLNALYSLCIGTLFTSSSFAPKVYDESNKKNALLLPFSLFLSLQHQATYCYCCANRDSNDKCSVVGRHVVSCRSKIPSHWSIVCLVKAYALGIGNI